MVSIPDFTKSELWVIEDTLKQRYGEPVKPDEVDTELRLNPLSSELTTCPALYWKRNDANFLIVKVGEQRYRCQFFYRVHQMYGTGVEEYTDLTECVVTLLQVQADYELKQAQERDKEAAKNK